MPEAQAEVLADEQARLIDERLATKSDVRDSEQGLNGSLRETESRLETMMEAMRADALRWSLGAIGLETLALLGAFFALSKTLH